MTTQHVTKNKSFADTKVNWIGDPVEIIGIGAGVSTNLGPAAVHAIQNAQILIGAKHQLHQVSQYVSAQGTELHHYPSPLFDVSSLLTSNQQKKIVMLASGDPLFFGIGNWLTKLLGPSNLVFHPNVSSVQVACARLGIPWENIETISLHGRPLLSLRSRLHVNRYYAILPDKHSSPIALAQELKDAGFTESKLWVVETIGSGNESVKHYDVETLLHNPGQLSFDPLHISLFEVRGTGGVLPEFPGIPDKYFITDGQNQSGKGMLSKREVRLNILSLLSPQANDISWDVGAGCGGVAVEWARWNRQGDVYAVESHDERMQCLQKNRDKFGVVQNLFPIHGPAPEILSTLPPPNAIFVGGSNGELLMILNYCWSYLRQGGRLVVSALTEKSRADLYRFSQQEGIQGKDTDWTELSISKSDSLKGNVVLRPNFPVLLVKFKKPIL